MFKRIASNILDAIILIVSALVFIGVGSFVYENYSSKMSYALIQRLLLVRGVGFFLLPLIYCYVFFLFFRATPGKILMKLEIKSVAVDGTPTAMQLLKKSLVLHVVSMIAFFAVFIGCIEIVGTSLGDLGIVLALGIAFLAAYPLETLTAAWSKRGQSLSDLAGRVIEISKN